MEHEDVLWWIIVALSTPTALGFAWALADTAIIYWRTRPTRSERRSRARLSGNAYSPVCASRGPRRRSDEDARPR